MTRAKGKQKANMSETIKFAALRYFKEDNELDEIHFYGESPFQYPFYQGRRRTLIGRSVFASWHGRPRKHKAKGMSMRVDHAAADICASIVRYAKKHGVVPTIVRRSDLHHLLVLK